MLYVHIYYINSLKNHKEYRTVDREILEFLLLARCIKSKNMNKKLNTAKFSTKYLQSLHCIPANCTVKKMSCSQSDFWNL